MFKPAWIWTVMLATVGVLSCPPAASADNLGNVSHVEGRASFEKRHTVVLLDMFPDSQPKTYWSLILTSGTARYEVNQPFAVGSETEPDSIKLSGVMVRPGSQLSVEGRVDTVSRDYSIISEIRDVNLIMDYRQSMSMFDKTEAFFGWACHSPVSPDPRQAHVYAQIWLANYGDSAHGYKLRILSDAASHDPSQLREVAYLDQVSFDSRGEQMIYDGSEGGVTAQVVINAGVDDRISNLPSELRFSRIYVGFDENFPLETRIPLECTRTRI